MTLPLAPPSYTPPTHPRHCFVTVGATVTFTPLLNALKAPTFLNSLLTLGFTHLTIQCGRDLDALSCWIADNINTELLEVECFDLKDSLMGNMALCRKEAGRELGIVLSHAGTGSVLDAIAANAPIVVIPNEALLDNHQLELAKMVESRKYGVAGSLLTLVSDIEKAHILYESRQTANKAASISSSASGPSFWDLVHTTASLPRQRKESDSVMIEG